MTVLYQSLPMMPLVGVKNTKPAASVDRHHRSFYAYFSFLAGLDVFLAVTTEIAFVYVKLHVFTGLLFIFTGLLFIFTGLLFIFTGLLFIFTGLLFIFLLQHFLNVFFIAYWYICH